MSVTRSSGGAADVSVAILPTAALTAATREAVVALCNRAFAQDPIHDFTTLFDFVTDSTHVLARQNDQLVGHACWATRWLQPEGLQPLRTAYVDAVATEPAVQRRGIGTIVMQQVAQQAIEHQLNALSSERAIGFYERLGWQRWQGQTLAQTPDGLRATPNDVVLIRRTPSTPTIDLTRRLIADDRGGQPW